jgi:hypothetical protein
MTMNDYTKPLPVLTPTSREFYRGCAQGKLLYQQCTDCGTIVCFPKPFCSGCLGTNLQWRQSSGHGRLFSFTVTVAAAPTEFADSTPYILAIVKLDEGFKLMTNIVECDFNRLQCDIPVEVTFEQVTDEITLPKFRPA